MTREWCVLPGKGESDSKKRVSAQGRVVQLEKDVSDEAWHA